MAEAFSFSLESPTPEELHGLWTDLERRANVSFFLSWMWIGTWVEKAGAPDLVLVGRAGGEIVCLGLLRRSIQRRHGFIRSRTLHLHRTGNAGEDVIAIEYNGFLCDSRFPAAQMEAIAYLRSNASRLGFDELEIGGMIEPDYEAVERSGHRTHVESLKTTAFVDLASVRANGGDYLSTISANSRYQIRRALKIYEARGPLRLQRPESAEEAEDFFDRMGALHEETWRRRGESGGAWRYPFLVGFHKRLIEKAYPSGLDIVRISCGDQIVGYVHCLVRKGWYASYLSGFAYEEDNKVKPGLVSFYLYIEDLLRSDAQGFDFLAGDHRYKTSLGSTGPNMYWFSIREKRPQLMMEDALRGVKQHVERLRGAVSR